MSMALRILAYCQNVVGWQLALNYMRTPPTHYYLEYGGQVAYLETYPYFLSTFMLTRGASSVQMQSLGGRIFEIQRFMSLSVEIVY